MAHQSGFSIQFALEGFSEIGPNVDFGLDLCRAAIDAGASVITCPDTIGSASHWQGQRYFVNTMNQFASQLKSEFPKNTIFYGPLTVITTLDWHLKTRCNQYLMDPLGKLKDASTVLEKERETWQSNNVSWH